MSRPDIERRARQRALTNRLRAIRKLRGLSPSDLARDMKMSLRAYQRFEAGETPADIERLWRFSQVTDCDPLALLGSAAIEQDSLVVRVADNKLLLILLHAFERFEARLGSALPRVEPYDLIEAVEGALDRLARAHLERDAAARRWLSLPAGEDPTETD